MSLSFVLSEQEYRFILRQDLMSFIERTFYELNPQAVFLPSPYIELMAARLDACRTGRTKRLIINLPLIQGLPAAVESHCEVEEGSVLNCEGMVFDAAEGYPLRCEPLPY